MDKLGVTTQPPAQEKRGWTQGTCPICGAEVERKGRTVTCINHGTEPFEEKLKTKDEHPKRQRD